MDNVPLEGQRLFDIKGYSSHTYFESLPFPELRFIYSILDFMQIQFIKVSLMLHLLFIFYAKNFLSKPYYDGINWIEMKWKRKTELQILYCLLKKENFFKFSIRKQSTSITNSGYPFAACIISNRSMNCTCIRIRAK